MTSSDLVALPHTWRPFGVRLVGGVAGFALVVVVFGAWFSSPEVRSSLTRLDIGTLVILGLIALAVWFGVVRCRVQATEENLVVVNGYRYHTFEWAQVVSVSMRRGAPWATIDLSDGTTLGVLAIQSADGARGVRAAKELKALAAAKSMPQER